MKSTICLNDNNEVTTIQGESEPTKSVGDRRPKKKMGGGGFPRHNIIDISPFY